MAEARPGDLVLTMGAGDITSLGKELVARLERLSGDGDRDPPLRPCLSSSPTHPSPRSRRSASAAPPTGSAGPASFRDVVGALAWARDAGVPVAVVGRGSNLLVSDEGFRGLVLRLVGRLTSISVRGTDLWCGGGASLPRAVQRAAADGLEGLEWGASIPGTVGGAVAMNAGAHAGELAHDAPLGRRSAGPTAAAASAPDDLALGYRRSSVAPGEVVAAAGFAPAPAATPR